MRSSNKRGEHRDKNESKRPCRCISILMERGHIPSITHQVCLATKLGSSCNIPGTWRYKLGKPVIPSCKHCLFRGQLKVLSHMLDMLTLQIHTPACYWANGKPHPKSKVHQASICFTRSLAPLASWGTRCSGRSALNSTHPRKQRQKRRHIQPQHTWSRKP